MVYCGIVGLEFIYSYIFVTSVVTFTIISWGPLNEEQELSLL